MLKVGDRVRAAEVSACTADLRKVGAATVERVENDGRYIYVAVRTDSGELLEDFHTDELTLVA